MAPSELPPKVGLRRLSRRWRIEGGLDGPLRASPRESDCAGLAGARTAVLSHALKPALERERARLRDWAWERLVHDVPAPMTCAGFAGGALGA